MKSKSSPRGSVWICVADLCFLEEISAIRSWYLSWSPFRVKTACRRIQSNNVSTHIWAGMKLCRETYVEDFFATAVKAYSRMLSHRQTLLQPGGRISGCHHLRPPAPWTCAPRAHTAVFWHCSTLKKVIRTITVQRLLYKQINTIG